MSFPFCGKSHAFKYLSSLNPKENKIFPKFPTTHNCERKGHSQLIEMFMSIKANFWTEFEIYCFYTTGMLQHFKTIEIKTHSETENSTFFFFLVKKFIKKSTFAKYFTFIKLAFSNRKTLLQEISHWVSDRSLQYQDQKGCFLFLHSKNLNCPTIPFPEDAFHRKLLKCNQRIPFKLKGFKYFNWCIQKQFSI